MKKGFRVIVLMLVVALCVAAFTSCTTDPTTADAAAANAGAEGQKIEPKDGKSYKIGMSMNEIVIPFYVSIRETVQNICDERGWELIVLDAQGDSNKQIADMEDLVTQGCDAILVNSYDTEILTNTINTLTAAGTPIVAIDNALADDANVLTCVQANNYGNGFECGRWIAKQLKGQKIKAALISGAMGTINSKDRRLGMIDGIIEEQLESEGKANLEIIGQGYTAWTEDQAVTVMEDLLSLNEDFNLLMSEADVMTMSAMKVLEERGALEGKVIAASADGQKEALELIKQGSYGCTGMNSPVRIGEMALDVLQKYFDGQKSFPAKTYTPAACVTIDNVDQYYDPNSTF